MAERIVTERDRLSQPSDPVVVGPKAKFLARRLAAAAADGGRRVRGVAAPQIGVHQRMFHWDFAGLKPAENGVPTDRGGLPNSGIACNPKVLDASDETWVREEGCLSFPRRWLDVVRPVTARFEWYTLNGDRCEVTLGGYAARIWLHETDHLNGVLFTERAAPGATLHRW